MNINDILLAAREAPADSVFIPEKWGQGRATFGGLVAAVMLERIHVHVGTDRPIRTIGVSFVAPVAPGDMRVEVQTLRTGKAATQMQATAYQGDQVCAVLLASFGADRESRVRVAEEGAPTFPAPEGVPPFPYIQGLTPDFTQHFDYRYTLGKMPFMGSDHTAMGGWIRLREAADHQPASVSVLLALLDAWPPAVFSMLKKPAAGSSLMWTISVVDQPTEPDGLDWWQYQADIRSSANGYSHIDATLWDRHGRAVMISRQTVCVFE